MGTGPIVFVVAMVGVLAVVGVKVLIDVIRDRPRDLSDTLADRIHDVIDNADQYMDVWRSLNRQCTYGDTWPEHDEDADEDGCWCRSCYYVEITALQDAEVRELFAGLVDTPELRDLAHRAERGLR